MKNPIHRIKAAWQVLTGRINLCVYLTESNAFLYVNRATDARTIIQRAAYYAFCGNDGYTLSDIVRLEMLDSILHDPSVILLAKHGGKPTINYDCASQEDFQSLSNINID